MNSPVFAALPLLAGERANHILIILISAFFDPSTVRANTEQFTPAEGGRRRYAINRTSHLG
jgi:hypothetical protein